MLNIGRDTAARLHAACEKSDPFAYDRAMAHMRSGIESAIDLRDASCKRLGISTDPKAVAQFLAK